MSAQQTPPTGWSHYSLPHTAPHMYRLKPFAATVSAGHLMLSWNLECECCRHSLEVSEHEAQHMAAEGLMLLICETGGVQVEAFGAVSQLAQLRRLRLAYPSTLADARLRRLSALSRLTSLDVVSRKNCSDCTGSWLAALAAARVPLQRLRLCDSGVRAGRPMLCPPYQLSSCCLYGALSWCSRLQ